MDWFFTWQDNLAEDKCLIYSLEGFLMLDNNEENICFNSLKKKKITFIVTATLLLKTRTHCKTGL